MVFCARHLQYAEPSLHRPGLIHEKISSPQKPARVASLYHRWGITSRSRLRALVPSDSEWWMNVNVIKQFSVYLKLQTFTLSTPSWGPPEDEGKKLRRPSDETMPRKLFFSFSFPEILLLLSQQRKFFFGVPCMPTSHSRNCLKIILFSFLAAHRNPQRGAKNDLIIDATWINDIWIQMNV